MLAHFLRRHFAGFTALFSGLLLLPWILGVPGNPSPVDQFVWSMGLLAIIAYLVIYQSVRSSGDLRLCKRPGLRARLDGWLFAAALLIFPVLCGCVIYLLSGGG